MKSVNEKLRFRDRLVWTVGLTVEIKLRFRDVLVWTVDLTVEIKLCFRDVLVWTVDLTVEIKLCFRDGLVWTVGLTVEIKLRFRDVLVWTVDLTVEIKLCFRDLHWGLHFLIKTKLVSSTLRTVVAQLRYLSYAFRVTNAHFVRKFNNTTRSACIYTYLTDRVEIKLRFQISPA